MLFVSFVRNVLCVVLRLMSVLFDCLCVLLLFVHAMCLCVLLVIVCLMMYR